MVGIANTHTLTSSLSSSHIRTLHFSPYNSAQLLQIVQSRLATLTSPAQALDANIKQFLPVPTLTLLTKKVAALTGDVRTLFEILRGAIDLAVSSASTTRVDDESFFSQAEPISSVTPAHVLVALKNSSAASMSKPSTSSSSSLTSNSGIVSKVADLGIQARLVLLAVLVATKRVEAGLGIEPSASRNTDTSESSSAGIDGTHLYTLYSHILRRGDLSSPVSKNEFSDLIGLLEGVGLVTTCSGSSINPSPKKKRMRFGRSASFGRLGASSCAGMEDVRLASGVWVDEVLRGLGVTTVTQSRASDVDCIKDVQEEEIGAIWMREDGALRKELKVVEAKRIAACSSSKSEAGFMDASLDA